MLLSAAYIDDGLTLGDIEHADVCFLVGDAHLLGEPLIGGIPVSLEPAVLPERVKCFVGEVLPVSELGELGVGQTAEGLDAAAVTAHPGEVFPADPDLMAVALAVDLFAVYQLRRLVSVGADHFHGLHSSLYLAICSGVSVSMPRARASWTAPSIRRDISLLSIRCVRL